MSTPTHNPPGERGPESRPESRPESQPESQIASFRKAQPYVDAVWQFIAAVALMSWLGHAADQRFGTAPWLLVTGVFLGFSTGLWGFVKVIWALDRRSEASQGKTQGDRNDGPGGPAKDGT